jgi:hypothetical protein
MTMMVMMMIRTGRDVEEASCHNFRCSAGISREAGDNHEKPSSQYHPMFTPVTSRIKARRLSVSANLIGKMLSAMYAYSLE